jgi:hypothetical protein
LGLAAILEEGPEFGSGTAGAEDFEPEEAVVVQSADCNLE